MAKVTKTYNVEDNKCLSLKEISDGYNINLSTLRARVARGETGDALVAESVHGGSLRAKRFDISQTNDEVQLRTLKEIAKMAEAPVATIRARVARGLLGFNLVTGYNPLNALRGREYSVLAGGTQFRGTINEIAEKYSMSAATLRARIKKGYAPSEIVNGKPKKIKLIPPKGAVVKKVVESVPKVKEPAKPKTMTADDLIAGLEKERDLYVDKKNKMIEAELDTLTVAA
jgi:hypothetical protein